MTTKPAVEKRMSDRVWDIATKAMVPISVIIGSALINHAIRLSVIESNRFTSKDGHALEARIMEKLPPEWLRDDMKEIKTMLKSIDDRVRVLEKRD